jgi:hypothetical protein
MTGSGGVGASAPSVRAALGGSLIPASSPGKAGAGGATSLGFGLIMSDGRRYIR